MISNSIEQSHFGQVKPNNQSRQNNFDVSAFIQTQNWPRLHRVRLQIAKFSLKKSIKRVHKQKNFQQQFDQIQIDQIFDQRVSRNIHYQEYSSEYADSSTINKGRFSQNGQYYGTVGSTGQGWVWNTANVQDQKLFTHKLTALKAQVKLCDIVFHPKIGKIPSFAPNICTSSSNGELFFWTFDPQLPQQKSIKLKPHSDRINSVEYHKSGNYLLSSSYDMTWSLWDCSRLQQIFTQKGHQREIHCSVGHPDGSLYFTGDLAGCGMVWDLRMGKGIYEFKQVDSILCCDFNPNGYELAVSGKSNLITIKDIRRLKNLKQIPAHTKLISGLRYSSDESILCSVSHDNNLKIWHGRSYIPVNLSQLVHGSKLTSVDINDGKIGTTQIQRKWVMWVLKKNGGQGNVKIEEISQKQQNQENSDIF